MGIDNDTEELMPAFRYGNEIETDKSCCFCGKAPTGKRKLKQPNYLKEIRNVSGNEKIKIYPCCSPRCMRQLEKQEKAKYKKIDDFVSIFRRPHKGGNIQQIATFRDTSEAKAFADRIGF